MNNIVFMGTPLFAEPALLSLIESKHNITAVYRKPPSQSGRSMNESKSLIEKKKKHMEKLRQNIQVI